MDIDNAPPSFAITPLTPAARDDYLAFFDHDAFADNPRWASCYCMFNQAPHNLQAWETRTGAQNRASAAEFIDQGRLRGYLAYRAGKVVGWCNANRYDRYTTLDPRGKTVAEAIGVMACFVVALAYRGQGIAARLLQAALAGFQAEGIQEVEAYPQVEGRGTAENCRGPLSMYLAADFEQVGVRDGTALVRKILPVPF
jgi:ribosomal protein S18 acetylase RimI-like enzyme